MKKLIILLLIVASFQVKAQKNRFDEPARQAAIATDSALNGRMKELTGEWLDWIHRSKLDGYEIQLLLIEGLKEIRKDCIRHLRFGYARQVKRRIEWEERKAAEMLLQIAENTLK